MGAIRRILIGFAAAAVVIVALVWLAGRDEVVVAMAVVDHRVYVLGFLATVAAIVFRGGVWVLLLRVVNVEFRVRRVYVLFLVSLFIRYITPYGQVTTEPVIAYLVASDGSMPFEDGLAGIVTADLLNYVPYYTLGLLGLGYFLLFRTVKPGILESVLGLLALGFTVGGLVVLAYWRRAMVTRAALALGKGGRLTVGRVSDRVYRMLSGDAIHSRVDRFYDAIDLLVAHRRPIIVALVAAHVGMVFLMLPVYTTALALGVHIPFLIVALLVAISKLGSLFPGPGGLGGIEATIVGGMLILVDVSFATAIAITLLYRVCTYWFTIVVGGSTLMWYSKTTETD